MTVPQVNSVSPNNGDVTGGYEVNVSGHYFTGATSVKFGGVPAAYTVVSDTSITVTYVPTQPDSIAGAVDVQVTTPAGTSAIAGGDKFTYTAPTLSDILRAITSLQQTLAPEPESFQSNPTTTGTFGNIPQLFDLVNHILQIVTGMPTITAISPSSASVGDTVVILGTGFLGATAVTFTATPANDGWPATFTIDSDTQMTVVIPSGAPSPPTVPVFVATERSVLVGDPTSPSGIQGCSLLFSTYDNPNAATCWFTYV